MKKYKLEKEQLSFILGFDKMVITRYLTGQIPSKENSDSIKNRF